MLIRPAQEEDFPAIATLTNRYILGSAVHFSYEPVSAEELRSVWRGGKAKYPWCVATLEDSEKNSLSSGGFAGYAKAGAWRDRSAYSWTVETALYVEPSAQRLGVGKALYIRLLKTLQGQGYHAAIAGITLPNEASVGLHEAVGFQYVGRFAEVGWKLDEWHDVGFWQLNLARAEAHARAVKAPG